MPKIRNIIIFIVILAALILVYVFLIQPSLSSNQTSLVSTGDVTSSSNTSSATPVESDFLSLLLNVKTIKLNVDIFSDPAFNSLHDSSVTLIPDVTTGRPNPFSQIGALRVATPTVTVTPIVPSITPTTPTTPITPTTPTKTSTSSKSSTKTPATTTPSTTSITP